MQNNDLNLIRGKNVIGLAVLSANENLELGIVKDLLISSNGKKTLFLITSNGSHKSRRIIEPANVRKIDNKTLTVKSNGEIKAIESIPAFEDLMSKKKDFKGKVLVTSEGKKLGKIIEYLLDTRKAEIVSVETVNSKSEPKYWRIEKVLKVKSSEVKVSGCEEIALLTEIGFSERVESNSETKEKVGSVQALSGNGKTIKEEDISSSDVGLKMVKESQPETHETDDARGKKEKGRAEEKAEDKQEEKTAEVAEQEEKPTEEKEKEQTVDSRQLIVEDKKPEKAVEKEEKKAGETKEEEKQEAKTAEVKEETREQTLDAAAPAGGQGPLTPEKHKKEESKEETEESQAEEKAEEERVEESASSHKDLKQILEERQDKFLLGKKVDRDISSDDGTLIIKKGDKINKQVLIDAKKANRYIILSFCVKTDFLKSN